jgi:hypothetical protein
METVGVTVAGRAGGIVHDAGLPDGPQGAHVDSRAAFDGQKTVHGRVAGKRGRSSTLLRAGRLVPNVVSDGGRRHGEVRFAGRGCS